jgi:hypothetical protein
MSDLLIFIAGIIVSLICAASFAMLLWAANEDGKSAKPEDGKPSSPPTPIPLEQSRRSA